MFNKDLVGFDNEPFSWRDVDCEQFVGEKGIKTEQERTHRLYFVEEDGVIVVVELVSFLSIHEYGCPIEPKVDHVLSCSRVVFIFDNRALGT